VVDLITGGSEHLKKIQNHRTTESGYFEGKNEGIEIPTGSGYLKNQNQRTSSCGYFQHLKEPLGFMKNPDIGPMVFWPVI
jgi:hypothetical protein